MDSRLFHAGPGCPGHDRKRIAVRRRLESDREIAVGLGGGRARNAGAAFGRRSGGGAIAGFLNEARQGARDETDASRYTSVRRLFFTPPGYPIDNAILSIYGGVLGPLAGSALTVAAHLPAAPILAASLALGTVGP